MGQRNFKKQISDPVDLHLSAAAPDMWDKILAAFRNTLDKAESTYLAKAKSAFRSPRHVYPIDMLILLSPTGFNSTEEENTAALSLLRKRTWLALRSKIDEQTTDAAILSKLRANFEERFRYDEQGVPRVWRPDDDIDGAFKKAKDQVRIISRHSLHVRSLLPDIDIGARSPLFEDQACRPEAGVHAAVGAGGPSFDRRGL